MNTDQERIENLRALQALALNAVRQAPVPEVHEAALGVLAARIYDLLLSQDLTLLKEQLAADLHSYVHLVNTLARLSSAALGFQRQHAALAERKAILDQALAAAKEGGLAPETLEEFQKQLLLL